MTDSIGRRAGLSAEPAASNPFCTRFTRPGALAFRDPQSGGEAEAHQQELLRRLTRYRRGLIVGPHGSGKSTLLQCLLPALCQRFGEVALVRLSAPDASDGPARWRQRRSGARQLRGQQSLLAGDGVLVVDGMEQLGRLTRLSVLATALRRRHRVLATSHRPLAGFPELFRTQVTPRLIESLAESLLDGASGPVTEVVRGELARRDLRRISNVRDLWFEMYDAAAKIEAGPAEQRG